MPTLRRPRAISLFYLRVPRGERKSKVMQINEIGAERGKRTTAAFLFFARASAHVPRGFAARSSRALAPVARSRSIVTQKKNKRLLAV